MAFRNFDELTEAIRAKKQIKTCAVVEAKNEETLKAISKARRLGLIDPLLIGNEPAIRECLEKIGENAFDFQIISTRAPEESAQKVIDLAMSGAANILMKGHINSSVFLAPIVDKKNGMLTGKMLSSLGLLEIPTYHKLLANTDAGITPHPTLAQKRIIIDNAVRTLKKIGVSYPKVAVLAALETATPKMPETMDAAALQEMNEKGIIKGCIISGPISYDLALNRESAKIKHFDSPVAGDADLIVFPDLTSGNLLGKALIYSARAKLVGLAIGARTPIVFPSRSFGAEDKYRSLVVACALTEQP